MSPIAYLDSLRMQYAMEELCHGKLRISEIAEKAGSNSLQAFSRKFTKFLGISPRDYSNIVSDTRMSRLFFIPD